MRRLSHCIFLWDRDDLKEAKRATLEDTTIQGGMRTELWQQLMRSIFFVICNCSCRRVLGEKSIPYVWTRRSTDG
ncbi:hypothetical protein EYF80_025047 [Liparis tanakae]|uniref:Uncharacterized protein n=1 Tax=Liparis tanakae TaxID=230148 RepID=A0A4Z2HGL0_9TELE|nr:hypothetical protein EYF80_025047 [Liparis tanakae]